MKLQPKQSAVVTGASGGLGEQFARQLAARGLDLTLVARSADKLAALAKELRAAHGVAVDVRPADLTDPAATAAVADELLRRPARPVDLLVNNAGLGFWAPLAEQTDEQVDQMLSVNVVALVRLTHAALPAMIARRAGTVLNIGSVAGFQPIPQFAVYAATKAFVLNFGEAVAHECRKQGVQVTTFLPGATATGFKSVSGMSDRFFRKAPSADSVAAKALWAVEAGRTVKCANFGDAVMSQGLRLMPRRAIVSVAALVTR